VSCKGDDKLLASFDLLTPAERTVFHQLLAGRSADEIAERLGNSAFTIANHTRRIFSAFGVNSRSQLLALFVHNPFKGQPAPSTAGSRRTSPSLTEVVRSIEGFSIALAPTDRAKVRASDYSTRFRRGARDTFSVAYWIEKRFQAVYPGISVTVLMPDGKRASPKKLLRAVREAYARY
jgi:DNA-binding CsgD family transcriptional regulator